MSPAAKQRSKPSRQVCPICALDDPELVAWEPEAPGLWRYTCTNHKPPFTWVTTGEGAFDDSGSGGIAEELGVYDDLLALFTEAGPYLEWGIVEYRYAAAKPDVYRDLVSRYSHTALGPTKYSASSFLGQAAGKLAREGHLALVWAKATGYWHYNGRVGAFALAPAAPDTPILSWAEFASDSGFDPDDWPPLGFSKGVAPKPRLVVDQPWTASLGAQWFSPDQLSYLGCCAWNHHEEDRFPATRLVVTEYASGVQDARAVCDECMESVRRYVGQD